MNSTLGLGHTSLCPPQLPQLPRLPGNRGRSSLSLRCCSCGGVPNFNHTTMPAQKVMISSVHSAVQHTRIIAYVYYVCLKASKFGIFSSRGGQNLAFFLGGARNHTFCYKNCHNHNPLTKNAKLSLPPAKDMQHI